MDLPNFPYKIAGTLRLTVQDFINILLLIYFSHILLFCSLVLWGSFKCRWNMFYCIYIKYYKSTIEFSIHLLNFVVSRVLSIIFRRCPGKSSIFPEKCQMSRIGSKILWSPYRISVCKV